VLPDENFNEKPHSAQKRPEKGKPIIQDQKNSQTLFAVLLFLFNKNTIKL